MALVSRTIYVSRFTLTPSFQYTQLFNLRPLIFGVTPL